MKNWLILAIISLSLLLVCCNEPEEEKKYGYVLFYTNAHHYWNCENFDVNIYIEDEKIGVLNHNYGFSVATGLCDSVFDPTLVIKQKFEVGTYNYSADFYCGDSVYTNGTILVEENKCKSLGLFLSY